MIGQPGPAISMRGLRLKQDSVIASQTRTTYVEEECFSKEGFWILSTIIVLVSVSPVSWKIECLCPNQMLMLSDI